MNIESQKKKAMFHEREHENTYTNSAKNRMVDYLDEYLGLLEANTQINNYENFLYQQEEVIMKKHGNNHKQKQSLCFVLIIGLILLFPVTVVAEKVGDVSTVFKWLGANDKIVLALIGSGGRGLDAIISTCKINANVEIKTVCDVKTTRVETAVSAIEKELGYKPKSTKNIKEVFDDY